MNLFSYLLFLSAHMILLVPPSLLCVSLSLFFVYSWLCWVVFFIAFYLFVCFLSWFGKYKFHFTRWASQVAQWKKNPSVNAGARFLHWQTEVCRCRFHPWVGKIPWRRAWQPTPVIFAWRIPWTEEPGRLQSVGSQSQTWLNKHKHN